MTTDSFCFYLQNRLIKTSQTVSQPYSDTSPFSIPCTNKISCTIHCMHAPVQRLQNVLAYFATTISNEIKRFMKSMPEISVGCGGGRGGGGGGGETVGMVKALGDLW